ncbi:hypothetical protein [Sessilibacter corallicola]|uniref:Uncharacterized protein n=1 Tax=Sessilibacter corallicola TaxID=2904075 RepID=A0ABQ0A4K5_9GAMM
MELINTAKGILSETSNNPLLQDYLYLNTSTTAFLENKANTVINVQVLEQRIIGEKLIRRSILYVKEITLPLLYAECLFDLTSLQDDKKAALIEQKRTVGDIFGRRHLRKVASHCQKLEQHTYQNILQVSGACYLRTFDLYCEQQKIAQLLEVVNEETLFRVYKPDGSQGSYA